MLFKASLMAKASLYKLDPLNVFYIPRIKFDCLVYYEYYDWAHVLYRMMTETKIVVL